MKKRKKIFNWDYSNLAMAEKKMKEVAKYFGYEMIDEGSEGFDLAFSFKKKKKKK